MHGPHTGCLDPVDGEGDDVGTTAGSGAKGAGCLPLGIKAQP